MAKTKIVAGIELGSSKTATVVAQVQTDPVSFDTAINIVGVSSVESKGIKKGQIVEIEAAVDTTVSSVEAAERMAGYNLDSAYISLGGAHILSQNSHGVVAVSDPDGEISDDDVVRAIDAASAVSLPASREVVHILPKEFIVDGESGVRDPVGMSGVRLEVQTHLVTASSAAIKNLKKAINEVGVNVNEMVFSGLASAKAALTKTEKELGCILIDIGGGTTSIAAYVDSSLTYSGVLPVGSKNVTNDLAIGLRVSLESAEKIKLALSEYAKKSKKAKTTQTNDQIDLKQLGIEETKKVSRKTLTEGIIRPRLNEIFTMVRLHLEKEELAARVPSGVILTGGGAETVGVVESAKRMLSLPVRVGKPRGIGGLVDDVINPAFAAPVGLVLYGAEQDIDQPTTSFAKVLKLPSTGLAGKLVDTIKDLLP
jgi:cell division protein FtsA